MSFFKERFARGGLMRLQVLPAELIDQIILLSRPTIGQVVIDPTWDFIMSLEWRVKQYLLKPCKCGKEHCGNAPDDNLDKRCCQFKKIHGTWYDMEEEALRFKQLALK